MQTQNFELKISKNNIHFYTPLPHYFCLYHASCLTNLTSFYFHSPSSFTKSSIVELPRLLKCARLPFNRSLEDMRSEAIQDQLQMNFWTVATALLKLTA